MKLNNILEWGAQGLVVLFGFWVFCALLDFVLLGKVPTIGSENITALSIVSTVAKTLFLGWFIEVVVKIKI